MGCCMLMYLELSIIYTVRYCKNGNVSLDSTNDGECTDQHEDCYLFCNFSVELI